VLGKKNFSSNKRKITIQYTDKDNNASDFATVGYNLNEHIEKEIKKKINKRLHKI
jgi:spermidine/putrescine-binding protein